MDHRFSACLVMVGLFAVVMNVKAQTQTRQENKGASRSLGRPDGVAPRAQVRRTARRGAIGNEAARSDRRPLSDDSNRSSSPRDARNAGDQSVASNNVADPLSGTSGTELMRRVVAAVGRHKSVSARVRHRTELFDQRIVGQGHYLQRNDPRGLQVSYLLTVKTNDQMVSLLQICDGRYLWTRQNAEAGVKLTRVDLPRLRRAGQGHPNDAMPVMLGGGLPSLLASLQKNFVVSPPQEVTLQGIPMWALAFRWNPKRIRLLSKSDQIVDGEGQIRGDQLPPQLPDRVFLLVGQDDLFPYHLDFRRSKSSRPLSADDESPTQSLVTLEFYEVQFDVPIDASRFVFKATGLKFVDETDAHINRLKQQFAKSGRPIED